VLSRHRASHQLEKINNMFSPKHKAESHTNMADCCVCEIRFSSILTVVTVYNLLVFSFFRKLQLVSSVKKTSNKISYWKGDVITTTASGNPSIS